MRWAKTWESPLGTYLQSFEALMGDKRTAETFQEIIKGIIGAGSLVCQRIARHSSVLAGIKYGSQRVLRFVKGESTRRSELDAEHLTATLRQRGLDHLLQGTEEEVWLLPDESDLRKPHAHEMAALMRVRDLDGKLVPGYRTINVLGVTPGRRGILYHRLYSSVEEAFSSQSLERQRALTTVSAEVKAKAPAVTAT